MSLTVFERRIDHNGGAIVNNFEALKRKHGIRLIHFCFLSVLDRSPELEEIDRYLSRLNAHISVPQLLQEIRENESAEKLQPMECRNLSVIDEATFCLIDDLNELSNAEFVEAAYQRFLGRRPDSDTKKIVFDFLANGGPRLQTAFDLANSPEGQKFRLITIAAKAKLVDENDSELSSVANAFAQRFKAIAEG